MSIALVAALALAAPAIASAAAPPDGPRCAERGASAAACAGEASEPARTAARRTRIVRMGLDLQGRGRPGPSYFVQVAVRVRVCGGRGRTVLRLTETSSPAGRSRPVLARNRRRFARVQRRGCQTFRLSYRLGKRFFGASRYRVGVRARGAGRRASGVASRKVDTFD